MKENKDYSKTKETGMFPTGNRRVLLSDDGVIPFSYKHWNVQTFGARFDFYEGGDRNAGYHVL